jgi:hypothetical protein
MDTRNSVIRKFSMLAVITVFWTTGHAQVTVTGPTCVVPGTIYQYSIAGNWDSSSTMHVCINGGVIVDSGYRNACTPEGKPVAQVLVDWDTAGNWGLTVTSSSGNAALYVSVTVPLKAGSIDSVSKTQMIGVDSVPALITCSVDTGGSCSPSFVHQWQQSADMVSWTDVQRATGLNLKIDTGLNQSTYYRRRATETSSGTIAYSDVAAVFVGVSTSSIIRINLTNHN